MVNKENYVIKVRHDVSQYVERVVEKALLEPSLFDSFFDCGVKLLFDRIPPTIEQDVSAAVGANEILLIFR